jgi:hypothetical protein
VFTFIGTSETGKGVWDAGQLPETIVLPFYRLDRQNVGEGRPLRIEGFLPQLSAPVARKVWLWKSTTRLS